MGSVGCGVGVIGIGAALPARVRRNEDWEAPPQGLDGPDPFRGAIERRVLEPDRECADLEIEACRNAIAVGDHRVEDIEVLVGATLTPAYLSPSNHPHVARALGVKTQIAALSVDQGCGSFVPQLEIGVRLLAARGRGCGLLYQSGIPSRTLDYTSPLSPVAGDGAAAQVIGPVSEELGFIGVEQQIRPEFAQSFFVGRTEGRRLTTPSASGERLILTSEDPEGAKTAMKHSPTYAAGLCRTLLDRHGFGPREVDAFVCTQPAANFADQIAREVGIGEGRWLDRSAHYERFGHAMQASVTLNLYLAWRAGLMDVGDLVLIYTQGGGLTLAAALLRWAIPAPASVPSDPPSG